MSKGALFFTIAMVIVQMGLYDNFWNVADQNWFDDFQVSSESLVLGRLAASEREGTSFKAGLLGRYFIEEGNLWLNQYDFYQNKEVVLEKETFRTYKSQIGGQGFIFSLLSSVSPFSNEINLKIFKFCSALLFAFILTLFLLWVYKKYGLFSAVITLFLFLISHWLTVFGRNLYWVVGVLYVPFIVMLFILSRESTKKRIDLTLKKLAIIAFVLVLIKCLFSGFELITTSLIMFVMPFVYYAVLNKWKWKTFSLRLLSVTLGSLVAVFLYFFVLTYQLSLIRGSFAKGFEHIVYSFLKRTSGNSGDFSEAYQQSLESTVPMVLEKYWNGIAIDLNTYISTDWASLIRIDFGELILIFIIFSLLSQLPKKISPSIWAKSKANSALIIVMWLSSAAALSWLVIFKGHSYIHTHTNFIVWYMPFCLFGFATIGSITSSVFTDVFDFYKKTNRKNKIIGKIALGALIVGVVFAQKESIEQYKTLKEVRNKKNLLASEAGFDVYLFKNKLWYFKDKANAAQMNTRFFLHIVPDRTEDLPEKRQKYDFDNLDFNYEDTSLELPWWYGNSNFLAAVIELPDYKKKTVRTGQYANRQIIWETSFQPY